MIRNNFEKRVRVVGYSKNDEAQVTIREKRGSERVKYVRPWRLISGGNRLVFQAFLMLFVGLSRNRARDIRNV